MKTHCVALIIIAVGWTLGLVWEYLVLSGVASPASPLAIVWYYGTRSLGPILLVIGSLLILGHSSPKVGVLLAGIACAILTVSVATILLSFRHVEPLEPKPDYIDYLLYGSLGVIALLADWLVFRLYQLVLARSVIS
jgi:hypothetical protein